MEKKTSKGDTETVRAVSLHGLMIKSNHHGADVICSNPIVSKKKMPPLLKNIIIFYKNNLSFILL